MSTTVAALGPALHMVSCPAAPPAPQAPGTGSGSSATGAAAASAGGPASPAPQGTAPRDEGPGAFARELQRSLARDGGGDEAPSCAARPESTTATHGARDRAAAARARAQRQALAAAAPHPATRRDATGPADDDAVSARKPAAHTRPRHVHDGCPVPADATTAAPPQPGLATPAAPAPTGCRAPADAQAATPIDRDPAAPATGGTAGEPARPALAADLAASSIAVTPATAGPVAPPQPADEQADAAAAGGIGRPDHRPASVPGSPSRRDDADPVRPELQPHERRTADPATSGASPAAAADERAAESVARPRASPAGVETAAMAAAATPTFAASLQRAAETLVAGSAAAAPPQRDVREVQLPVPVHASDFVPRFGDEVALLVRDGVQEARLQVHPVEMGPISVQVQLDGSQAQVHLGVDNAATRSLLEAAMPTLAAALHEQGLTLTGGGVFQQARRQAQDGSPDDPRGHRSEADGTGVATGPDGGGTRATAATPRLRRLGAVDVYA